MAPASHDPYAPANRRPHRAGFDTPAEHPHACLVCVGLAEAGLPVPELAHEPAQHIGDETGDVILSVDVPASALTLTDDAFPIRWTSEWWQKWTPDGVEPLHVANRVDTIPEHIEAGIRAAGGGYREVAAMDGWWERMSDDDRSSADAYAAGFDDAEWAQVLAGWRDVLAKVESGELPEDQAEFWPGDVADAADQAAVAEALVVASWFGHMTDDDDRDAAAAALNEIGAWLASCEDRAAGYAAMDALVGGTGPHKVAEYERAIIDGLSHDEAMAAVWPDAGGQLPLEEMTAEFTDPGPVPEGHVRVGFSQATDNAPDGTPMGYGMTGDVPTDAKAALAFLADQPEGAPEDDAQAVQDRARLVLAAELTRAPSARRKSVLDAVAEQLAPAEVEERTRQVDAPEQITEGPAEGNSAG